MVVSHQQMNGVPFGCESIMADNVLMFIFKGVGPRTEPCGTPGCTGAKAEQWLDKETLHVRTVRYDEDHWRTVSVDPK